METKHNLTLVTALFDIGRGEMGTSFQRSFDHYKECFGRLLKATKLPMIIFCDSDLDEFIWQHRDRSNTSIVRRTVDDLKNFPFYKEVQSIRTSESWLNQAGWLGESTQGRLELYNPLVMSKQFFLNDATLFNNFNTNYFLWVDAGITNTVSIEGYFNDTFEKRMIKKMKKMLYIAYPYEPDNEIHGFSKDKMYEYAGEVTNWVARGGVFGGPKHLINEVNEIYYNVLHDSLTKGYMGTEESIFTIIAHKHKEKFNVHMIEGNGLVYKFFEDIQHAPVKLTDAEELAMYFLVFNTPKQFEYTLEKWKKAYPDEFKRAKKYVINNSNDSSTDEIYEKMFVENEMQVFRPEKNIGICGGRQYAAEHFDKTEHDYYIFIEEDMGVHIPFEFKDERGHMIRQGITDRSGLTTYHKDVFSKAIDIMEMHELDYLKLSFTEVFGDNFKDWAWENVPMDKKAIYFPDKDGVKNDRTKVEYWNHHKGLPYYVGHAFYCNWPILFNKAGNKKVFLDVHWENQYEQTWMSFVKTLLFEGKVKAGGLMISIIDHQRHWHYDGKTRRENKNYTN